MAKSAKKQVQILATTNPHLVQVHDLTSSQFSALKKEQGRTTGTRQGISFVGIAEYLDMMDVSEVLASYTVIHKPNSYQNVEVS